MRTVGGSRRRLSRMVNSGSPAGSAVLDVDRGDRRGRRRAGRRGRAGRRRAGPPRLRRGSRPPRPRSAPSPRACWRARGGRRTAGSRRPAPRPAPGPSRRSSSRALFARPTQPRPCQPTWTTLPSSTSTGTVRWPPASARSRARRRRVGLHVVLDELGAAALQPLAQLAGVGAARRCRRVQALATAERLQALANHVIDGRLHFLNARDVVARAPRWRSRPGRAARSRRRRSRAARRSAARACAPLPAPR